MSPMEDTIHINISISKTDTHYISGHFVRIWPHLLTTVNWFFKNPIPAGQMIQYGIGLTCINNLAIAVEGFIADIIFEHIENNKELKDKYKLDIDKLTWYPKKELYNELFSKKIEDYAFYEGIVALMNFRNNLAHGRTYSEFTQREQGIEKFSEIGSDNKRYQTVREYLIKNNLLKESNTPSNSEIPWKLTILAHFAGIVKFFLNNILNENESKHKLGIETEFKMAYS